MGLARSVRLLFGGGVAARTLQHERRRSRQTLFQGLPSPAAAALIAGFVWLATDNRVPLKLVWLPWVAFALTVYAGVTMVSTRRSTVAKHSMYVFASHLPAYCWSWSRLLLVSSDPPLMLFGLFVLYGFFRLRLVGVHGHAREAESGEVVGETALRGARIGLSAVRAFCFWRPRGKNCAGSVNRRHRKANLARSQKSLIVCDDFFSPIPLVSPSWCALRALPLLARHALSSRPRLLVRVSTPAGGANTRIPYCFSPTVF